MSRSLVGGVIGGVIGFYFGGPQGAQVGFAVGSAIGASTDKIKQQGPRLNDLKAPQAAYGSVLPYIEGSVRTAGVWVWTSDKREIPVTSSQGSKGGPTVQNTEFIYKLDAMILLAENQLGGIRRVWSNGKLVYSLAEDASDDTLEASLAADSWDRLTFYSGAPDQLPDPTYEAAMGVGNVPAYRGRGGVFIEGLNLGSSGQIPVLTFEVFSAGEAGAGNLFTERFNAGESIVENGFSIVSGVSSFQISEILLGGFGLSVVGRSKTGFDIDKIRKELLNPVTVAAVDFDFYIGSLNVDDAGVLVLAEGDTAHFAFIPRREEQTDPDQKAMLRIGAVTILLGEEPLAYREWLHLRVRLSTNPAESTWTLTRTLDGLTLDEGSIAATPFVCDRLEFHNDVTNEGEPTSDVTYANIVAGDIDLAVPESVSLAAAVQRQCLRAGLTEGQIDVSALSGNIRGFAVSQITSPRTVLEMLATAYQLEILESGDKIVARPRAQAAVASIAADELGVTGSLDEPAEALPLTRANELEMPAQVVVSYANQLDDYQDGAEQSERLGVNLASVQTIDLAMVLTPQEAKRIAEVQAADISNSLMRAEGVTVDRRWAALEPGDPVTVTDPAGRSYRLRIVRITDSGPIRTLDAALDEQSAMTSNGVTDEGYVPSSEVVGRAGTQLELLDIPLLRDVDDGLNHYMAIGRVAGSGVWPGATVYRGEANSNFQSIAVVGGTTYIGRTAGSLGDFQGIGFDEVNALTVIGVGELESFTREQIVNGEAVPLLVGSELLFYCDAVLLASGSYRLTRLLRGRRGTEFAIAGHADQERVVCLSETGIRVANNTAAQIGVTLDFCAVTSGGALDRTPRRQFANSGLMRKPFAPVDGRISTLSNGDLEMSWKRRTRRATNFTGATGAVVPLGEVAESYEIDLYDATDNLVVTAAVNEPRYQFGTLLPEQTYGQVLRFPIVISGVLWGVWDRDYVPFTTPSQAVVGVDLDDGSGVALSPNLGTGRTDAVAYAGSICYVAVTDIDESTGAVTATRVRRVDLATLPLAISATWESPTVDQVRSLYWDGTKLWSYALASGTLRRHDPTTLAVEASFDAPDMGGVSLGGCMAAGGGKFFAIDGHTIKAFTSAGLPTIDWTFDAATLGADVWPSNLAYVGSLLFVSSPSRTFVLSPTDGSLIAPGLPPSDEVFADADGNAMYRNGGYIRRASGTTGALTSSVSCVASGYFFGPVSGSDRLAFGGLGGAPDSTTLYQFGGDLAGFTARVFQMSAGIGRGYPLVIDL